MYTVTYHTSTILKEGVQNQMKCSLNKIYSKNTSRGDRFVGSFIKKGHTTIIEHFLINYEMNNIHNLMSAFCEE